MMISAPLSMAIYRGLSSGGGLTILSPGGISGLITYTQSGNLTYFDSTGTLQTAAVDTLPRDFDPSTLVLRGYPFWEARTNSIRNNTMQGASAGSPGTLPTNWSTFTTLTGLTRTLAFGTENGINYCDITLSGTPSAAGSYYIQFETSTQVAASNTQVWTSSAYYKLAGGSLTGVTTINNATSIRDSGGAELGRTVTVVVPTSSGLATQRTTTTETNNSASTAAELQYTEFVLSGAAINITLRIGLPQLELGAFATPAIKTSSAAITRAAPSCAITGTNFSSWYNQSQGTFVVASQQTLSGLSGAAFTGFDVSDNTNNNTIIATTQFGLSNFEFIITTGGVAQADLLAASTASASKRACAFKANDIAASYNGAAVLTDASATLPTVDRMHIGQLHSSLSYLNGWISSLSYYGARLPNASLQSLST